LFTQIPPGLSHIAEALKALDPDAMNAREALDWIYLMKQKLEDES